MASFTLKAADATIYNFNTLGDVSSAAGAAVGRWSTNEQNQVVLTPTAGGATITFTPAWSFDANNAMSLTDAAGNAFSFAGSDYELVDNALKVETADSFSFELFPHWSLDPNNNLVAKIGATTSTIINGWVQDSGSNFVYFFTDQVTFEPQMLVFSGSWQNSGKDSTLHLTFAGEVTETKDAFTLALTGSTTNIDQTNNHLIISYNSSQGQQTITLVGSLNITPAAGATLDLTFSVLQKIGANWVPQETQVKVNATFQFNDVHGTLEVNITDENGGLRTLTVAGTVQIPLQENGLLNLSYQIQGANGGAAAAPSLSVAVNGSFVLDGVNIKFTSNYLSGGNYSIGITANAKLGNFVLDGGIAVKNDPQGRSVMAFLGFSF